MMATQHRHARPLPVPEVSDSDFGAFQEACQQQPASHRAELLLAATRQQHTHCGYTSFPAYAEALEDLVRRLCQEGQR